MKTSKLCIAIAMLALLSTAMTSCSGSKVAANANSKNWQKNSARIDSAEDRMRSILDKETSSKK